jgi:osmotically-inducible protein OsmY
MSDKQLRADVLDELAFEPAVDAANIGAMVERGIVTLTGHVRSCAEQAAAAACAWRVKGVRALVQDIEVRPDGQDVGDELLAERALSLLRWDSTVPPSVHVTVHAGRITLDGEVEWEYQRRNAEIDLRRLSGLAGLTNAIRVVPRSFVQHATVKSLIDEALRRNAHVEADRITVDVTKDGSVRLTGRVSSLAERMAVERAAWSAPGVSGVSDQLTVE